MAAEVASAHAQGDLAWPPAAVYPEDVITRHRAFTARHRSLRPREEHHEPTAQEWRGFLDHFELREWVRCDRFRRWNGS
ncbi:hypothetical protein [Kitasatospora terrestris]